MYKKIQKPEEEGILLETFANFSVNWKVLHRELRTIRIDYSAKDVGDSINYFHKIKLNKLSCEKAQFFVAEKKKEKPDFTSSQLVEGEGGMWEGWKVSALRKRARTRSSYKSILSQYNIFS